jgi:hypothetical protein
LSAETRLTPTEWLDEFEQAVMEASKLASKPVDVLHPEEQP